MQTMAQEELDSVTMRDRLPTFDDRPRLPYIDAICKEVTRWRPVLPLGKLLLCDHQRKIYDNLQVYPMPRQRTMSIMVSSSPRVSVSAYEFRPWPICIFLRCGGDPEHMVRSLPVVLFLSGFNLL